MGNTVFCAPQKTRKINLYFNEKPAILNTGDQKRGRRHDEESIMALGNAIPARPWD